MNWQFSPFRVVAWRGRKRVDRVFVLEGDARCFADRMRGEGCGLVEVWEWDGSWWNDLDYYEARV